MYSPRILPDGLMRAVLYQLATAYAVLAVGILLPSFTRAAKDPPAMGFGHPDFT